MQKESIALEDDVEIMYLDYTKLSNKQILSYPPSFVNHLKWVYTFGILKKFAQGSWKSCGIGRIAK